MKFMYFFDDKIKRHIMKGKKYCNPAETGRYTAEISCIRQNDVNLWFYTKNGMTIAIDSGHLNFPGMSEAFQKVHIDPCKIRHLLITHADVDHCGGIDVCGTNIYPNAQVYLGKEEQPYLDRTVHRMKKFGLKIKNCVRIAEGYYTLENDEVFHIEGIKIQSLHTPGHTLGHTCYVIDDQVLFSGDCLAINSNGGYSFFDFFTQYPDLNKESLLKLREQIKKISPEYICTGHSGIRKYSEHTFAHINESAQFSKKKPFDEKAPYDAFSDRKG